MAWGEAGNAGHPWHNGQHAATLVIEGGDDDEVSQFAAVIVAKLAGDLDAILLLYRLADDGGAVVGVDVDVVPPQGEFIAADAGGRVLELQPEGIGLRWNGLR